MNKENIEYGKKLFLFDAFGALLSAFLLGIILVRYESIFGIPKNTLYFLAILPCFFAIYDIVCYFKVSIKIGYFLKVIAYINIVYCFISIVLAFYHYESLTYLGWLYIILEIIVVVAIALIELKASRRIINKK